MYFSLPCCSSVQNPAAAGVMLYHGRSPHYIQTAYSQRGGRGCGPVALHTLYKNHCGISDSTSATSFQRRGQGHNPQRDIPDDCRKPSRGCTDRPCSVQRRAPPHCGHVFVSTLTSSPCASASSDPKAIVSAALCTAPGNDVGCSETSALTTAGEMPVVSAE